MTNLALITGASSGLGREFARIHAAKGGDLIITARRAAQLDALKRELEAAHGVAVHVLTADLSKASEAEALYASVKAIGTPDVLINNAGIGGGGEHLGRDLSAELGMIELNVTSLVTLTHHIAKDMVARGSGQILNVGSTAGFIPGPMQAIYFATKAFVNSYSQALAQELDGKGVTVTVLTPGYVETEFADAAALRDTAMVKQGGASAPAVAKIGYDAMQRGTLVAFNDWKLKAMFNWIIPFLPRKMLLKFAQQSQSAA